MAWGTFWTWDARLTFTLLLWFIFLAYFLVRRTPMNQNQGVRFAAVLAILGGLDIPLIHMSVYWFPTLHPEPVYLRPEGPTADSEFTITLIVAFCVYTLLFLGLLVLRYAVEVAEREWTLRSIRLGRAT